MHTHRITDVFRHSHQMQLLRSDNCMQVGLVLGLDIVDVMDKAGQAPLLDVFMEMRCEAAHNGLDSKHMVDQVPRRCTLNDDPGTIPRGS